MDHRDAMNEWGTYLKSLPEFEFNQENMEATFVESGEDREIDSPPKRERSELELLGAKLDALIADKADRLSDKLKVYTDTPWHGFSKHLLQSYTNAISPDGMRGSVTLKEALINSLRKRTTAHFIRAYFRISDFGRDHTDYKTGEPTRIPVKRMNLEISLGIQHWLTPEGKTWQDRYWPKRFEMKFMVNDSEVDGTFWSKAPFQFDITGLSGVHTLAEVGRRLNSAINGEVTPEDLKPQLVEFLSTRSYDELDNHWIVSDEVLAEARKELGDWVLHFLYLEDKVHTISLGWEVCPTCNGKGKHTNPSIDAHGISSDEFAEDPDFAEDYHRGIYDVPCYECKGRTTSLGIDLKNTSAETLKYIEDWFRDEASYRAEVAAERRMGA